MLWDTPFVISAYPLTVCAINVLCVYIHLPCVLFVFILMLYYTP